MSTAEDQPKKEQPPREDGESIEDYHVRLQQERMDYTPMVDSRSSIVADQTHDKTQKILDQVRESGEPIFVLRATDILAPMVVANYLELIEKYTPREHAFHGQVGEIHDQMLDWQRANGDKVGYPD